MVQQTNKHEWIYALIGSIITVVITAIIGFFVWTKQNNKTQEQTLYEHKLNSFETFTKCSTRMIYLTTFKDRIELEQAKLEYTPERLLRYNKFKDSSSIGYKARLLIQANLKMHFPIEYDNYMKALDYYSEFASSYLAVTNLFRDSTNAEVIKFNDLFSMKHYQETILGIGKLNHGDIHSVDGDKLIDTLLSERNLQFTKALMSMKKELIK